MPALTAAPAILSGWIESSAAIFSLPTGVSGLWADGAFGIAVLLVSCFGWLVGVSCALKPMLQQARITHVINLIQYPFKKGNFSEGLIVRELLLIAAVLVEPRSCGSSARCAQTWPQDGCGRIWISSPARIRAADFDPCRQAGPSRCSRACVPR